MFNGWVSCNRIDKSSQAVFCAAKGIQMKTHPTTEARRHRGKENDGERNLTQGTEEHKTQRRGTTKYTKNTKGEKCFSDWHEFPQTTDEDEFGNR
jgi:hypothetical protein